MSTSPDSRKRLPAFVPALLALVCLMIGLPFLLMGRSENVKARAASAWHETEGTMVTSRVTESWYRDPEYGTWELATSPELLYQYTVDGRTYTGSKLAPVGSTGDSAERTVEKYPLGARVAVFYDPQNPSNAALTNESRSVGSVLIAIGILMVIIGVPFAVVSVRLALRR